MVKLKLVSFSSEVLNLQDVVNITDNAFRAQLQEKISCFTLSQVSKCIKSGFALLFACLK